ncbi:MAG: two-component system response regulator OmpR [Rugosibacter sp.]
MNDPATNSDTRANDSCPKILVLDDDAELRSMLVRYLGEHGHVVRAVENTTQLERLLTREPFNVLVLDVMMPGENGLNLCRRLRAQGETIPILMLTARGDPMERIIGLEMGADDYLPKPFNPRELLARIQAMLRRQAMQGMTLETGGNIRFGGFELDIERRCLHRDGELLELSSSEFSLLRALATNPNRPLGRERLMELAHGREHEATDRSVDVQVLRLRRLIEADAARPRHIQTVWGVGYVFVPEPPEDAA